MIAIPIWYRVDGDLENIGPVCYIRCAKCRRTGFFNLFSSKVTFAVAFVPLAKSGPTWVLECPSCRQQLVLSEYDAANAISLNQALMSHGKPEISPEELKALAIRYPLPQVDKWLSANTDWPCPECNSDVPETFDECWNCGYTR